MKTIQQLSVPIGIDDDWQRVVHINPLLHTFILGKSRTGKSSGALLPLILGPIRANLGCAVIDPHGPLSEAVLSHLTPEELRRVVLIDPLALKVPGIGYFDSGDPELSLQNFEANMEVRAGKNGGPRTSEIFRAISRAVVGFFKRPTILHVYKMLNRDAFARSILSQSKDPTVQDFFDFWYAKDVKAKDRHDAFGAPRNKIDELMQPGIREIVAQESSLDWAKLMDERAIIIVNVRKGRIGANKAKAIGNLVLMNIMLAAFRREHPEIRFPVFVDEFHNFDAGIDVETALAEAAKFGVSYTLADQTMTQLRHEDLGVYNDEIILGNCSNIISFRVSGRDAKVLAEEFADERMRKLLVNLPNYQFYASVIDDNAPILRGPVKTYKKPHKRAHTVPLAKALAWATENSPGSDRRRVERLIMAELQKAGQMLPVANATRKKARRRTRFAG